MNRYFTIILLSLAALAVQAQIKIGGNVYGGGNEGDVDGSSSVTVRAGDLNAIYGGARVANVGGSVFVNIDGEHASSYILVNYVYGGNDISGTIGSSAELPYTTSTTTTTDAETGETTTTTTKIPLLTHSAENSVNKTWNALVRISSPEQYTGETGKVYIGQLFGGGNGAYDYTTASSPYYGLDHPTLARTYLEIVGGSIVYAYGGGNNATVTDKAVICVNNPSDVVNSIKDKNGTELLTTDRTLNKMGISSSYNYPTSDAFQIGRLFGGNNQAEMAIRPTWNLMRGSIRNLYSGGNKGAMTSEYGLLLEIPSTSAIWVDNLYGGCRMADVIPKENGSPITPRSLNFENGIRKYYFPEGLSARVIIEGGHVRNVYGGNDITGKVYGGNAIGIRATIYGDVYGGGNGSYPYTDNPKLKDSPIYGDFYYDPATIPGVSSSVEALNAYRPNAEQVSIRLAGSEAKKTVIHGGVFIGGNCATLAPNEDIENPLAELKIGSYVIADSLFLGNNGADMIRYNEADPDNYIQEGVLRTMQKTLGQLGYTGEGSDTKYNSITLTEAGEFASYMDGVVMTMMPSVTFDDANRTPVPDPATYKEYTSYFGSIFCGGNVGSMKVDKKTTIDFKDEILVYNKVVGGCNNANVPEQKETVGSVTTTFNAAYNGGLIGTPESDNNILELNFSGLKIQPKRWNTDKTELVWNTISASTGKEVDFNPETAETGTSTDEDLDRRLNGGHIYGGCYNSGHVNGNVVINLNESVVDRQGEFAIFDQMAQDEAVGEAILYNNQSYDITKRISGVILDEQGMDVLGSALNVFGGGYGKDSEIWGSVTINLKKGYAFQIFGGGEQGVIGKPNDGTGEAYIFNGKTYRYNPKYSCTINVHGSYPGTFRLDTDNSDNVIDNVNMAAAEFVYGGGFEGPICGNTIVNLGNGRVFNSFAGSCNADILGHTETYVGQWTVKNADNSETTVTGFPWVRDHIYGGNDLGGKILGMGDFSGRLSAYMNGTNASTGKVVKTYMHGYDNTTGKSVVTSAAAYTEYTQGRVNYIFGGCYGDYDYTDRHFKNYTDTDGKSKEGFSKPRLGNAFINFRPNTQSRNSVTRIHGAGQGHLRGIGVDSLQNSSYILVDIPQNLDKFEDMEVFGTGAYSGIGMGADSLTVAANLNQYSAIIDLFRGQIKNAYGGSFEEGFTRRAIVNVPRVSTIQVENLFGGAYGADPLYPCDVYEAQVNYHSENAIVKNNIYGGNNNADRTLYGQVNIDVPVYRDPAATKDDKKYATIYGAGYGVETWSQYTEVNLESGAIVNEVYGGGQNGKVINRESLLKWKKDEEAAGNNLDISMPGYVECGLAHMALVRETSMGGRYNTNVHIKQGATVCNYAYGGGLGDSKIADSGDVWGTTYIDLLGGTVKKDLYAAGTTGAVRDAKGVKDGFDVTSGGTHINGFVASSSAYIMGGTARNVYGGGWAGAVGYHEGVQRTRLAVDNNGKPVLDDEGNQKTETYIDYLNVSTANDIPGETHVIIGKLDGVSMVDGIPCVERNAYGGGEGGAVWGTTNITLNKGYIGYRYFTNADDLEKDPADEEKTITYIADGGGYYQEKLHDETWTGDGTDRLKDSGNIFGGGYIDNSSVDITNVEMYGGHVRNALFGGGEIAAVGRGIIIVSGQDNSERSLQGIYKAGKTHVTLYDGYVHRNVFGGGRGYNNLGEGGMLYSDGYVFGQTDVKIYGGEVGTDEELANGNGNVFGGGDIGYVYSAYENNNALCVGGKDGVRYDGQWEGYYYKREHGAYNNSGQYIVPEGTENDGWFMDDDEYVLTEDCKVLIEPHCKVQDIKVLKAITQKVGVNIVTLHTAGTGITNEQFNAIPAAVRDTLIEGTHWEKISSVTINNTTYSPGQYVPTTDLNTLSNKNTDANRWSCLDVKGIIIHNAVFAGGNTSSGSSISTAYVNATSVFGNATASVHDIYHRDLITVGTGHTGGLYGDGNLTFVDGYRGLNITNYGTDYYTIEKEIDIDDYHALPEREAAYYELRYKCVKECVDKDGTRYNPERTDEQGGKTAASTISADDLLTLFVGIYFNADYETRALGENDDKEGWTALLNANGTPNELFWEENGVCSRYAGRIMNTIQRADFCGVFGSRMVMQGARDRVPEVVDFTNYTINRVREVSLNQQYSQIPDDLILKAGVTKKNRIEDQHYDDFKDQEKAVHGNYFGIYNIVNYLGALSSDVRFDDVRLTENTSDDYKTAVTVNGTEKAYGTASYLDWKQANFNQRIRNNGKSINKVALASGVYLELTTEKSSGTELREKDWGYITGIIELDLINVQTGIGGGFVYAKNEHRTWTFNKKSHVTLTALNADAISRRDYDYTDTMVPWETSGNFVHSTQTIIDDCYNISGKYEGSDAVPAHYWYIKGSVYVYNQYISAYTGAPNAYSESVDIPLTITAASHGKMTLLNVMPNRYAYYATPGVPLGDGKKVVINDVDYYKNDPISYWDWYLLSASEKELFVEKTYVTIADCKIGETEYPEGYVMLPSEYTSLKASAPKKDIEDDDSSAAVPSVYHVAKQKDVAFDFVFRSSNNLSHHTGYILTYKVNNPTEWNTWYTKFVGSENEKQQEEYDEDESSTGPTYHLTSETGSVLGQRKYEVGNLISKEVEDIYQAVVNNYSSALPTGQATFEPAYIMTENATVTEGTTTTHLHPGATVSKTYRNDHGLEGSTSVAYVVTSTIQMSNTEFILLDTKMTEADKTSYIDRVNNDISAIKTGIPETATKLGDLTATHLSGLSEEQKKSLNSLLMLRNDIRTNIQPAYYCTSEGYYGGNYYQGGRNYRALEAFCSMSKTDRDKFAFNYDALDLLVDSLYSRNEEGTAVVYADGQKYQYDSSAGTLEGAQANVAGYSLTQPVNYTATYGGTDTGTYNGVTLAKDSEYSRADFEKLPNEKRHYSPVKVDGAGTYYVVNTAFQVGNTPYAVGTTISSTTFGSFGPSDQAHVTQLKITESDITRYGDTFFFCREGYTVGHNGEGQVVTSLMTDGTGEDTGKQVMATTGTPLSGNVPVGTIISASTYIDSGDETKSYYGYDRLVNMQKDFTIHGISPTETSTFFVSRNSDIFDLSKEKIITVIYQYDYEETDASGNITPVSERHVLNIHIEFKSGIPIVEDIRAPQIVIPGDKVALRDPNVTPGAYEVTGGGWKLFENVDDAESHVNGIDYSPNSDPLYWYQDGYYVAYYAKSYLGETFSNHVQVSVANYHDLKNVMNDKDNHYYVDNPDVKRDSKIYIEDYSRDDDSQNALDLLKQFYDLSVLNGSSPGVTNGRVTVDGSLKGHSLLDSHVKGGADLEFFLKSDIDHPDPWTSIGNDAQCFEGTLHGDGHTVTGLDHSLFGNLCGSVYNLGVTGSFAEAGVANTGLGYVENCWIKSDATATTSDPKPYPVFGSPSDTKGVQLVNSYYPESNSVLYDTGTHARGTATPMADRAFYNGTVAYNLNGFYLYKRYCDNTELSGSPLEYNYWKLGSTELQTAYYGSNPAYCSSGYDGLKYVEDRYRDGDFRYANGYIPEGADERQYINTTTWTIAFHPIWPDDYIFFGQMLTYGYSNQRPHEDKPSTIVKSDGRLLVSDFSNRVYRAPAYYRSKNMDVAHFNAAANLAAYSKPLTDGDDNLTPAYPNMTAIDFAGHYDVDVEKPYKLGLERGKFYAPLLDDDGLHSIANNGETPNLLVYVPSESANQATYDVLNDYFEDPTFSTHYDGDDSAYKCVAANTSTVHGHLVQSDLMATNDHLLVDKRDFNCPIAYSFDDDYRMWYQRTPDNYVDVSWSDDETPVRTTTGWEGISIPFEAELVTTNDKGEITHFYDNSRESLDDTPAKIGHEYWLRKFTDGATSATDASVFVANMTYPDGGSIDKEYTNTFLWDYYYKNNSYQDKNSDNYLESDASKTYYSSSHTYGNYARLQGCTPYIIGFPGGHYYEFDLSGSFEASTAMSNFPTKLGQQTITFASEEGIGIRVSDDETLHTYSSASPYGEVSSNGYTFRPNYMKQTYAPGTIGIYTLNATGGSYDKVPGGTEQASVEVLPFRPYFAVAKTSGGDVRTRSIIFSHEDSQLKGVEDRDLRDESTGSLDIYPKRKKIVVESSLNYTAEVRIINVAGITINAFTIEPGETVETRVNVSGVYIVETTDSRYTKKLAVK